MSSFSITKSLLVRVAILGCLFPLAVYGEILIPPTPADQLTATVDVEVTEDPNTHLYTYRYMVSNSPTSAQEIWFFALELGGDFAQVFNATAPTGWTFGRHNDRPIISWAATEIGELPADDVDDGNVLPSPFNIKPGQTAGPFSVQSLTPPGVTTFYAEGFTKLPAVTGSPEELLEAGYQLKDFTQNSFKGSVTGPVVEAYTGGRRPSVDGFLVFLNFNKTDNVFASPATIVVKFAIAGENVNKATFNAILNGRDVTSAFVPDTTFGGDLKATFALGSSPLQSGRNVLITSVEGTVPDTSRTAADVDRVTFTVQ